MCSRGVVEYDAEGFTKLTLLLMWKDFCFLVHGKKVTKPCTTLFMLGPRAIFYDSLCILILLSLCSPQWISLCTSPGTSPPSPSSLCTTSPVAGSCIPRCRSRIPTARGGTATRWPRGQSKYNLLDLVACNL